MPDEEQENAPNMANPIGIAVLGKLPKFDGRSSVKKFIKSIEKRSLLESWTDEVKARIVRYLCTDLAEAFIDSNPELELANFDELCEHLNTRFGPKISRPEAYSELMSIRQNRQSVDDYAGQIESTAASLSDVIADLQDVDARDELLISVFMSGLDPVLKRSLVVNTYETFSDLVRAAKRFEKTFDTRRNISAVNNQTDDVRTSPHYNNDRYSSYRPPTERNAVICWNCGGRGHIQRHCKRPRNRNMYADPPADHFNSQRRHNRQPKN